MTNLFNRVGPLPRRGLLGLGLAAGAGTLGLSACTGAGPGTGAEPGAQATATTLRLFTYEDDATIGLLKEQVATWDATAGMTTTVDSLPGSGAAVYPDKLRTELLGGAGPDLWRIWGGQIGAPYARAHQAMDLSDYYAEYKWDDRINPNAVAGMTFDGMKAGVPYTSAAVGAWLNKELFARAKIDALPTTYDELEAVNEALVGAGITPLATAGKYGWHIMRLFEFLLEHTAGPDLHDKLLVGDESWDRAEVVDAFTLFKKWQDSKWIPDGALGLDPADVEPGYVQGRFAYTIAGAWTEAGAILAAEKDPADFDVFALPTDQTPWRTSGFVEGYMISAKSGNPDKAANLLDFLVKPETQKALQITSSTIAGAEPDQNQLPLSYKWMQTCKDKPFYTIQDQAFPKQQADQYFTVQSDLLQGKIDPAAASKQMQEIVSAWTSK